MFRVLQGALWTNRREKNSLSPCSHENYHQKDPPQKNSVDPWTRVELHGSTYTWVFCFFFIKYVVLQDLLLAESAGVEPWVPRAHYKVTPWFSAMRWSTPWVPNPHTAQESTYMFTKCGKLTVLGFLNVPGSELQNYGLETLGGYRNMGHIGGGKGVFRNRIENFSTMCCWNGSRYDSRWFHSQTQVRQQGKSKEQTYNWGESLNVESLFQL